MKRFSIGVAFLAGSWMLGLGFYTQPDWLAWSLVLAAGIMFLLRSDADSLPRAHAAGIIVPALPSALLLAGPYRAVPLMLAAGALLRALPAPRRWPRCLGRALTDGAFVLLAQGLAIWVYALFTSRSHELPGLLARSVLGTARLLGIHASYTGSDLALYAMRKTHLAGATWELLLDPVTLCFATGAAALVFLYGNHTARSFGLLLLAVIVWLPVRVGLMLAIFLHRVLLTDYEAPFDLMNQFWSPWVLLAFLSGVVVLTWRMVPPLVLTEQLPATKRAARRETTALALALLGTALVTVGMLWDPVGRRKPGRVLVDEYHSDWEPTGRPFDTEWYGHDAGYNYACIYDYCSRYFDMSRLTNRIDRGTLADCDVLILKVPTWQYEPDEVDALVDYVEDGGSLLLVGEHTDVFLTSTHLNQVARRFGFEFRNDCLFGIDTGFEQRYAPPPVPHPVMQNVPPIDLAVSCSIRPTRIGGRTVMRSTGLWNLPADYHASNYYPQMEEDIRARYGAFIQLWATRFRKGRILAFTDSTIFSNFSTFEPGKSELMVSMIEWLNHGGRLGNPRPLLVALGLLLTGLALAGMGDRRPFLRLASASLLGWVVAAGLVQLCHRQAMPFPEPVRPLTRVAIDRTVSDAPLSKAGFIKASEEGFGIFEQWLLRLGYFPARDSHDAVFNSDLVVFLEPDQPVPATFRERLEQYVADGGKVLILDSPRNKDSVANSLLYPFGMSVNIDSGEQGELTPVAAWQSVPVKSAHTVRGGAALAHINGKPVAAAAKHGKGVAVIVGFGGRFNDDNMGITTDIEPTPELREVFQLQFDLLRAIVEDTLPPETVTPPEE